MTNLEKAIAVMERVQQHEKTLKRKLFNHRTFQTHPYYLPLAKTEEQAILNCGTTCCFLGWIAIAPEFAGSGIQFDSYGDLEEGHDEKLQKLLGISEDHVNGLVYNIPLPGIYGYYYGKPSGQVTPQDVIDKLNSLIQQ